MFPVQHICVIEKFPLTLVVNKGTAKVSNKAVVQSEGFINVKADFTVSGISCNFVLTEAVYARSIFGLVYPSKARWSRSRTKINGHMKDESNGVFKAFHGKTIQQKKLFGTEIGGAFF